ncbi:hypothetical protein BIV57_12455 [Mangrovactinospora gilvigrisea]|uniref:Hydrolase n=1 Tax=Mangrovactinospora gilvigrisea TaxID=1428644 RepID=A0A1J7BEL5_9ACTN|nr:HAD family hydrolase [Mangrovactinospora gilvigrisea]OIV37135.1 hypothetical protein BIV57_12455 [Mangrovactinospora gilvigrisea]
MGRDTVAVLFDVDDTLFDYGGAERDAIAAHLRDEGLAGAFPSAEAAAELWHAVMQRQYARFLAGELTFPGQQAARAREFAAAAGRPLGDEAAAAAWFGRYHVHYRACWRAFPDAAPALAALRGAGVRLGVVSNSSAAAQRPKLARLGLDGYLADGPLVCAGEFGAAKPDPSIFLAACAELGLPPERVAYVGDRRDLDAEAAAAAGLTGVWLDRAGSGGDAGTGSGFDDDSDDGILTVTSLAELAGLLRAGPGDASRR